MCERRPFMEVHGPHTERLPSEGYELLKGLGIEHEERVVAVQTNRATPSFISTQIDALPTYQQTLKAMRAGEPSLNQGLLVWKNWIGRPDFLRREEGKSSFGGWHYRPEDAKAGNMLNAKRLIPVAYYALLLERVQGRRPEYFTIYLHNEVVTERTDDHIDDVEQAIERLEEIVGAKHDPGPYIVQATCGRCPWVRRCSQDAQSMGHLSLLNGMQKPLAARLKAQGIHTVHDLAAAEPAKLLGPYLPTWNRAELMVERAKARLDQQPRLIAGHGAPPRRPVEAFLDCETFGSNDGRDVFLWGLMIRRGQRRQFNLLWSATPKGTRLAWKNLLRAMRLLPPGTPIFHYGNFERQMMRKAAAAFGGEPPLANSLVDVGLIIRRGFASPDKSAGLKTVAERLGFHFNSKISDGLVAQSWYANWLVSKGQGIKRELLKYNRQDLAALAQGMSRA